MKAFVEKQIDELLESGPEIIKGLLGVAIGCTVNLVLVFRAGFLAYFVGMWVTAVVGLVCYFIARSRPFGKGLLVSATAMVSLLPVMIFGAVFQSLG